MTEPEVGLEPFPTASRSYSVQRNSPKWSRKCNPFTTLGGKFGKPALVQVGDGNVSLLVHGPRRVFRWEGPSRGVLF